MPLAVMANVVKTEHVTAELVAERSAVQPGGSVRVGLRLQHIPHWHTYWRNPGDSGLPTTIDWQLPAGTEIGEIEWPAPKRLPIGPLVNYGYEDELLLPALFTAPADARPGQDLVLRAQANWLVCKDVCIPESGSFELRLPVVAAGTTPGSSASSALFERAAGLRSVPIQGWTADLQQHGRELLLTLQAEGSQPLPAALPDLQVFPYAEQVIDPAVHELYRTPRGYALKMKLMADAKLPSQLQGIAVAQSGSGAAFGTANPSVEFSAPWREVAQLSWPEGSQPMARKPATMAGQGGGAANTGLFTALLLAFAGGMLLNLMPCVFPVLSIKLLGLTRQAQEPAALRKHALAYGAGVLATFLALAGALIALQTAGSAVGWGFQLQEPGVVFVLALLFIAIGLNLMGTLELANLVPQRLLQWDARSPGGDAFGCGVLAVVAASPCTAPFMGAALGYALTQSASTSLLVFAALGVGMALPYMLLTVMPGWRQRLPRSGPWMIHLRQGLAFPMFATAVWLLWVLGQQAGIDAMARVLMAVVGLGLLVWAAGIGGTRGWVGKGLGAAAIAGLLVWSWPRELPAQSLARSEAGAVSAAGDWLAYDETVLADLAMRNKPVFVDFTAAWCVSCQVNKRLVLHTEDTLRAFAAANVTLMQADWTRRDPLITAALARLGRNGVPVYVLFRPGLEPLLLPEILSPGIVRDALATLQDPRS